MCANLEGISLIFLVQTNSNPDCGVAKRENAKNYGLAIASDTICR
jgi:hypothetical protein